MKPLQLQENLKKFTLIEQCPIRNIISIFSGKWQMLILCVLAENHTTRFTTLSKAIPDISPKVLSDTLRKLEKANLIERHIHAEIPPRVDYSLTPLGHSLTPILHTLITWAITNYPTPPKKSSHNQ